MDRIGGPQSVRDGILESLTEGITVTAKISWLTGASNQEEGSGLEGKARWIHCTPLLGSDEKVGVWMIGTNSVYQNEELLLICFSDDRKGNHYWVSQRS